MSITIKMHPVCDKITALADALCCKHFDKEDAKLASLITDVLVRGLRHLPEEKNI